MPPGLVKARLLLSSLVVALFVQTAGAFDPVTVGAATWLTTAVLAPVGYLVGCATAFSPPVRAFGNENAVYGLDWGSLACHAGSVYGLQMSFCGGSFERRLYGLQLGILASGYAVEKLPFDSGYHFCNLETCRLYGLQVATFAAKTATANGAQVSLVNTAQRLHGLQVGLVNTADDGVGLQIGLVNCAGSGLAAWLPGVNLVY